MIVDFIWKHAMEGVWGPHALFNNLENGGPECAEQSTFDYKVKVNLILVSLFINFNTH